MLTKVKMFFESKGYRHLIYTRVYLSVVLLLSIPYIWIKTLIETIQLYREYPDPWDRQVEISRRQEDQLKKELESDLNFLKSFAIFIINLMAMAMDSYLSSEDIKNYSEEDLQQSFKSFKSRMLKCVDTMNRITIIPSELVEKIQNIELDTFKTKEEISDFANYAIKIITDLQVS